MKFFKLAKKMALKSNHSQHRMSCILTKGNNVISIGINSTNTHPRSNSRFKAIHAEFDSIVGLPSDELDGCSAYIFRERRDGSLGCAKPCEHCFLLLQRSNIKRIYYSDYDGYKVIKI